MAHNYQKRWVFTWNADSLSGLPNRQNLIELLDRIAVEGVFQRERGLKTDRLHYQGRFVLKGNRLGKKRLLEIFQEVFRDVTQLTLEPEILYDSTKYCTKEETRSGGPWYVGTKSYKSKNQPAELKLRMWQQQLLEEIEEVDVSEKRDRKVFWIQDNIGGAGKSTFLKYLSFGQKDWQVKKMPLDKPDRIRMAICKIVQKEDVDIFAFDFTRTRGEDVSNNNLFQIVEEIKNGHVVSVMYGNPMEVAMPSPHVLIFTNEKLEDYRDYLSEDRWQPYLIAPDRCLSRMIFNHEYGFYEYTPIEIKNNIPGKNYPQD